ncbi:MAG: ADP-ribosylglycohydrolase family protein [Thermodesulfobacteriota bacterium]
MLGAIAGDVVGSVYEGHPIKFKDFSLFGPRSGYTDDTVLTVAVAWAILEDSDYGQALKSFGRKYPAGYGMNFYYWLMSESYEPYDSWGNGSAMRVSPVGFAFDSVERVLAEAKKSAQVTHNHPEGIKGAQATALAIYLARTGADKNEIRNEVSGRFGYRLDRTLDEIRPHYYFHVSSQRSVPESILCFLEATDFEDALRNAVSLGGDADTMACIAGGLAEAFYRTIPPDIVRETRRRLPEEFLEIIDRFYRAFAPEAIV